MKNISPSVDDHMRDRPSDPWYVIFLSKKANDKCYIFVISPGRQNMLPNVSKMWRKWYEEFKVSYPDFKFLTENVKFEEVRVESQEDAVFKALGKTIYQEKRGPTMLCYQTDKDSCPIKSEYYFLG